MVAYSFKPRFVAPIQAGTKQQTIRARGKRPHARPGGLVQLYTGMRTKACRKIVPDVVCVSVVPVRFDLRAVDPKRREADLDGRPILMVDKFRLKDMDLLNFVRADGFSSFPEMVEFWLDEHGPILFEGVCIRWREADHAT